MNELLRKEWRDARWIIIGLWAIAPIASLALKFLLLDGNRFDENASAGGFIPAMLLLYVLAVGADLVAADASSGRIGFFAALPVRPRTLWGVKAGFLFGGALVYFVALLFMEAMFLWLAGLNGLLVFVPGLPKYSFLYAAVAVVAAATLMYSTLIDRGFAAVVAALLTVAGIAALAWYLHPEPGKEALRNLALVLSAFLFVAMIAGSYLAFTRGRIQFGSRLRRLAFAGGAFAVLFAAPVGLSVVRAATWLDVDATDTDLQVQNVWTVGDDGDWAVVVLRRASDGPFGLEGRAHRVAVNLRDGRVRRLGDFDHNTDLGRFGFTGPGRFEWSESYWVEATRTRELRKVLVDLETGRRLSVGQPTAEEMRHPSLRFATGDAGYYAERTWEIRRPGRAPIRLNRGEQPYTCSNAWGILIDSGGRVNKHGWVLDVESGVRFAVPRVHGYWEMVLLPTTPDGVGFAYFANGSLVRLPMDGSAPETVFRGWGSTSDRMSPSGDHLLVRATGGLHLLRAEGARVIRLDGPTLDPDEVVSRWEKGGTRFVVGGIERLWLGDAADEEPKLIPLPIQADAGDPVWFSGDRLLLKDRRLTLWTLDGTSRQILPAKEIP